MLCCDLNFLVSHRISRAQSRPPLPTATDKESWNIEHALARAGYAAKAPWLVMATAAGQAARPIRWLMRKTTR
ncbi:MAG: hypothetical protein AAF829_13255 [Pseudomonadota bacterium]